VRCFFHTIVSNALHDEMFAIYKYLISSEYVVKQKHSKKIHFDTQMLTR
jgi:hypothetical protein